MKSHEFEIKYTNGQMDHITAHCFTLEVPFIVFWRLHTWSKERVGMIASGVVEAVFALKEDK